MNPKINRRPERIGDILREQIRTLGWTQRLREEDIHLFWDEVVGPQIAAHARPSHIVNRRLTVVTESPVWTQQLSFLKTDLLRRILRRLGPDLVTDLYFVTGKISPAAPPPGPEPVRDRTPPPEIPADLELEISAIADHEVRESVRRLCRAGLRHREERQGRGPTAPAEGLRSGPPACCS